jgi:hypothetical protein
VDRMRSNCDGYQLRKVRAECEERGELVASRATRGRLNDCSNARALEEPCVPPQVAYWHMRRWQRRGVKLPGQCTLVREGAATIVR